MTDETPTMEEHTNEDSEAVAAAAHAAQARERREAWAARSMAPAPAKLSSAPAAPAAFKTKQAPVSKATRATGFEAFAQATVAARLLNQKRNTDATDTRELLRTARGDATDFSPAVEDDGAFARELRQRREEEMRDARAAMEVLAAAPTTEFGAALGRAQQNRRDMTAASATLRAAAAALTPAAGGGTAAGRGGGRDGTYHLPSWLKPSPHVVKSSNGAPVSATTSRPKNAWKSMAADGSEISSVDRLREIRRRRIGKAAASAAAVGSIDSIPNIKQNAASAATEAGTPTTAKSGAHSGRSKNGTKKFGSSAPHTENREEDREKRREQVGTEELDQEISKSSASASSSGSDVDSSKESSDNDAVTWSLQMCVPEKLGLCLGLLHGFAVLDVSASSEHSEESEPDDPPIIAGSTQGKKQNAGTDNVGRDGGGGNTEESREAEENSEEEEEKEEGEGEREEEERKQQQTHTDPYTRIDTGARSYLQPSYATPIFPAAATGADDGGDTDTQAFETPMQEQESKIDLDFLLPRRHRGGGEHDPRISLDTQVEGIAQLDVRLRREDIQVFHVAAASLAEMGGCPQGGSIWVAIVQVPVCAVYMTWSDAERYTGVPWIILRNYSRIAVTRDIDILSRCPPMLLYGPDEALVRAVLKDNVMQAKMEGSKATAEKQKEGEETTEGDACQEIPWEEEELLQPTTLVTGATSLVSLQFLQACVNTAQTIAKIMKPKDNKSGKPEGLTAAHLSTIALKGVDL